jgi:hypothetical protein
MERAEACAHLCDDHQSRAEKKKIEKKIESPARAHTPTQILAPPCPPRHRPHMSDAKASAALDRAAAACPSLAPALQAMARLHSQRLWHQLTDAVEAALATPEFR